MKIKTSNLLKNKYIIILICFLIWMTFCDRNKFITQIKITRELKNEINNKKFFKEEIKKDSTKLNNLKNNIKDVEKLAREKYLMKKDGEDIYIIREKEK